MHRKHILILSSWFPTYQNPYLGNFVHRQAQLLSKEYEVTVINTVSSDTIQKVSISENKGDYRLVEASFPNKTNFFARKFLEKKAFERALKTISEVDAIIGNILLPKGWQFILAKKHYHCPLIYIEHGSYFRKDALPSWRKIDFILKRQIERQAEAIIAVSDFLKQDMQYIFESSEIDVIGNHVDSNLFSLKEKSTSDRVHFLHVSTLDPQTKNIRGIIDACYQLKENNVSFSMTIISDEDYIEWQSEVNELGLNTEISFVGPLSWGEVAPYYQKADAFILNSTYESFSIVLAEAWSTGTPVISTPVGIAHDMNAKYGLQTKINDTESLIEAMSNFNSSDFDATEIRKNAEQYSSENILKKWVKKIDSLG